MVPLRRFGDGETMAEKIARESASFSYALVGERERGGRLFFAENYNENKF